MKLVGKCAITTLDLIQAKSRESEKCAHWTSFSVNDQSASTLWAQRSKLVGVMWGVRCPEETHTAHAHLSLVQSHPQSQCKFRFNVAMFSVGTHVLHPLTRGGQPGGLLSANISAHRLQGSSHPLEIVTTSYYKLLSMFLSMKYTYKSCCMPNAEYMPILKQQNELCVAWTEYTITHSWRYNDAGCVEDCTVASSYFDILW